MNMTHLISQICSFRRVVRLELSDCEIVMNLLSCTLCCLWYLKMILLASYFYPRDAMLARY